MTSSPSGSYCLVLDPLELIYICQASSLKMSWTAWNFWWISSFPMMQKRATEGDTRSKVKMNKCKSKNVCRRPPECYFTQIVRPVKTMPWAQERSRVRTATSGPEHESTSGTRKPLRRSLGLETFPNVLIFRSYDPCTGKNNPEAAPGLACTDSTLI